MTVEEKIKSAIEPLYTKTFGKGGFSGLRVEIGEDHAGEPAVFVKASVHRLAPISKVAAIFAFEQGVRATAREVAPDRFCYVSTRTADATNTARKSGTRRLKRLAS